MKLDILSQIASHVFQFSESMITELGQLFFVASNYLQFGHLAIESKKNIESFDFNCDHEEFRLCIDACTLQDT